MWRNSVHSCSCVSQETAYSMAEKSFLNRMLVHHNEGIFDFVPLILIYCLQLLAKNISKIHPTIQSPKNFISEYFLDSTRHKAIKPYPKAFSCHLPTSCSVLYFLSQSPDNSQNKSSSSSSAASSLSKSNIGKINSLASDAIPTLPQWPQSLPRFLRYLRHDIFSQRRNRQARINPQIHRRNRFIATDLPSSCASV